MSLPSTDTRTRSDEILIRFFVFSRGDIENLCAVFADSNRLKRVGKIPDDLQAKVQRLESMMKPDFFDVFLGCIERLINNLVELLSMSSYTAGREVQFIAVLLRSPNIDAKEFIKYEIASIIEMAFMSMFKERR